MTDFAYGADLPSPVEIWTKKGEQVASIPFCHCGELGAVLKQVGADDITVCFDHLPEPARVVNMVRVLDTGVIRWWLYNADD